MSEKELEKRKKELDARAIKLAEGKEEIEKRTEKTREGEKKLAEKETELDKKKVALDLKEKYLEAARVVRLEAAKVVGEVIGKVGVVRNLVVVALILSAIAATMGTGLWFHRIPAGENRIADKIIVLDQKITALAGAEQASYRFVAESQKAGDKGEFVFDVEKMEGKVFTAGIPGGKNLYVEAGDTVVITLVDTESNVTTEKTFEKVQPGDVIKFVVKQGGK